MTSRFAPKPDWLKVRAPGGDAYHALKGMFRELKLFTVCEEARCPNVGECWREGTATIMLLGETCTRHCRFCAVDVGNPAGVVDEEEPEHVAIAVAQMDLVYVVLTMVNRDDLDDGGAGQVAKTVARLRQLRPDLLVETLVGDFQERASSLDTLFSSPPDVFAHNIEVVERLSRKIRDVRASYGQSLRVLASAKARGASLDRPMLTKSSIMVGIGETDDEVDQALVDLRGAGVDIVTIGQYLRPTTKHAPVDRYVTPEQFDAFAKRAEALGFLYAASGPLVRSSYKAAEVFLTSLLGGNVAEVLDDRLARARVSAERVRQAHGQPKPQRLTDNSVAKSGLLSADRLLRREGRPSSDDGC